MNKTAQHMDCKEEVKGACQPMDCKEEVNRTAQPMIRKEHVNGKWQGAAGKSLAGKTALYRGSLKSCNYRCSYCPFSKRRMAAQELEKDRGQWLSFVGAFAEKAQALDIQALMVAPYGEALIHPWYWEGLAQISACPNVNAVGAQTNLSFPISESLALFDQNGGDRGKLRLWATFHPEMATVGAFVSKCTALADAGVALCAGAVGVPENIQLLQKLRKELPPEIYLWVNKMDGLKRSYTDGERNSFLGIDPYFLRELVPIPADASQCRDRLFVEGNGKLHACNISTVLGTDWEALCAGMDFPEPKCSRKLCSCYLAYGGRTDFMNQILFGPYPIFRIPRRPKAVFFDIEGTLLQRQKEGKRTSTASCIPEDIMAGLTALSLENIPLFFATTLPYQEARKRCRKIWRLFSGGIFAGGAHLILEKGHREEFYDLEESCLTGLAEWKQRFHFQILAYRNQGKLYKITLHRPSKSPWDLESAQAIASAMEGRMANTQPLADTLSESISAATKGYTEKAPAFTEPTPEMHSGGTRYFIEGNCLQIVSSRADKANGVRTLCQWIGISPKEAAAAGNSAEDAEMLELCGL